LTFLSLLLTFLGDFLLISTLFPLKKLCVQKHHDTKAWRILSVLIVFFIAGYGAFGVFLLRNELDLVGLGVATILFGGAIFVYSVVKLTQSSVNKLTLMAAKEHHYSMHDELTDLPNQNYFHDKIDAAIFRAHNIKKTFVVFLIDLNHFKEINTSIGYFYADFLLQQIASRIKESVRNLDITARLGGDKFAILLPDTDLKRALAISNNIIAKLAFPFNIERNSISVEISIGIALYPEHGDQADQLLHNAHIAMCEALKSHVSYSIFEPQKHHFPFKNLIMAGEVRDAIKNDDLILFYQPQISVINNKLSGVEALVRWQHPARGIIEPDYFIDIIEQTDQSKNLVRWVLNEALKQQSEWKNLGLDIKMSVNLSIKNLHDYEFPSEAKKLIEKWQVEPNQLTLEITESGLMVDPGRVTRVVSELKEAGINLSIDDFGTGYSSLAYLRKFPAREIKIDKSFVLDMLTNEDSAIIVKSTIDLAHNIGRLIVAEGVENHGTYTLLKRLGCDILQGFFFSRALPPDEFLIWHNQYEIGRKGKAPIRLLPKINH
jgi:diguanylate cyclase (GGDEF)-like protein